MLADPGSSYALFAAVWGLMCLVAAALVTALATDGAQGRRGRDAERRRPSRVSRVARRRALL